MPSSARVSSHAPRKETSMSEGKLIVLRGGVWHTDFTVKGNRIRKSIGRMDKDQAEKMAQKMKEALSDNEPISNTFYGMLNVNPSTNPTLDKEQFLTLQVKWDPRELIGLLTGKNEFYLEMKAVAKKIV